MPAPLKFLMKGDMYMSQFTYDSQSYYKLIVDAKTKEAKKVPLRSVPYLESLKRDVVTGIVYYCLRTDYKGTVIRALVPKRVFSDECDVMNELMGAGFDLTPATVNGFMDVVFQQEKNMSLQSVHSKMGWVEGAQMYTPVFLFDKSYGDLGNVTSWYSWSLPLDLSDTSTVYLPGTVPGYESDDLDQKELDQLWKERIECIKKEVLPDIQLRTLYCMALSSAVIGRLGRLESLQGVKVQLDVGNVLAAVHLVASVVGNMNRWMYACPGERVANGVPLIDWTGDLANTVLFYTRSRDEVMLKLPVPDMSPEREGEFCAAVSDRNGMDLARLAGELSRMDDMGFRMLYQRYSARFDENDFPSPVKDFFGAVLMAAYWIGECTGLDFQLDEMQEYLASLQKELKKVSSQSEKTYRYMMEWIQKNRKHFTWGRGSGATQYCDLSQPSKVDIYGKIQMDADGKPQKYYVRKEKVEQILDDVGISSVILSNWKQAELLLCDRGSLWCRRVIDPESQKKEAVYVLAAKGDEVVTTVPEEEILEDDLVIDAESDEVEEADSDEEWPEDPDDWDDDESAESQEDDGETPDNMEDDIDESEFEPDVEEVEVDDDDWDLEDDDITDEFDDGDLIDENGDKG